MGLCGGKSCMFVLHPIPTRSSPFCTLTTLILVAIPFKCHNPPGCFPSYTHTNTLDSSAVQWQNSDFGRTPPLFQHNLVCVFISCIYWDIWFFWGGKHMGGPSWNEYVEHEMSHLIFVKVLGLGTEGGNSKYYIGCIFILHQRFSGHWRWKYKGRRWIYYCNHYTKREQSLTSFQTGCLFLPSRARSKIGSFLPCLFVFIYLILYLHCLKVDGYSRWILKQVANLGSAPG